MDLRMIITLQLEQTQWFSLRTEAVQLFPGSFVLIINVFRYALLVIPEFCCLILSYIDRTYYSWSGSCPDSIHPRMDLTLPRQWVNLRPGPLEPANWLELSQLLLSLPRPNVSNATNFSREFDRRRTIVGEKPLNSRTTRKE